MLMCFCEEPMVLEDEAGNIIATRCGHIFHNTCLVEWLCKSETCPQCRREVTQNEIFRLYPASSNELPNEDINVLLQSCLDSMEQMTEACKEKDNVIANLKHDVEKVKKFGRGNAALKSLLQMLNGLKDMATLICQTIESSKQQDAVTEPRRQPSDFDGTIAQPRTESLNAGAAVIVPRTESPDAEDAVIEPRTEDPDAEAAIIVPRTESPDAEAAVIEPRTETPAEENAVIEPRTEPPDAEAGVIEPRTGSSDAEAAVIDIGVTQQRTESSDLIACMIQPSTESHNTNRTVVTQNSNTLRSSEDAETEAIKSSLNTLERVLLRISKIKNSNSENQ